MCFKVIYWNYKHWVYDWINDWKNKSIYIIKIEKNARLEIYSSSCKYIINSIMAVVLTTIITKKQKKNWMTIQDTEFSLHEWFQLVFKLIKLYLY